ncbi:MAG: hypothetical protein MR291_06040 [Oscillospiraceae bacterium]|nr:hypothetical protein [Oscillospiraceae bacterium]
MTSFRVLVIKTGFAVLFLIVFAVMLALLCAAAFGIPAGIMVSIFGFAVKLFRAQFIVTSLSAETMLFGGLAAAFGAAFCGIAAVELGYLISGVYLRVRRKCDILLGWKPL